MVPDVLLLKPSWIFILLELFYFGFLTQTFFALQLADKVKL